jgi:diguanylate cyclase (GGDEF)-like protein/PAS domain S-box-containing protein
LKDDRFQFNPGARDLLGYQEGEILPDFDSIKALLHPDDRPGISDALRRHLAGETTAVDRVARVRRRSGDYMWTLIRGRVTRRGPSDRPVKVSGTVMDVSKWKELERRLRELATTDELTGLLNRRAGVAMLDREMAVSERQSTPLSMVLLDIDHFKQINDSLGHDVGDQVLEVLGRYLEDNRRQGDHAVRWGGEEFAIILPATGEPGAQAQAQRLFKGISALAGEVPPLSTLSASMGVVTRRSGESPRDLMKRADALMYQAKQDGRACIRSD